MKKVGMVAGMVVALGVVWFVSNKPLKMDGEITRINGELITVELTNEQLFDFYGDGYYVGEDVKVSFDTKDSNNYNDWEITNVVEA